MGDFASITEFLQMGTHGPYVWSVYGITLLVIVGLGAGMALQKRKVLSEVRKVQKRGQI